MPSRSNLDEREKKPRSYGTPIQPDVRTGPPAQRNKVGEADAATRRRMLDQRLRETEPVKRKAPAPARTVTEPSGVSPNAARLLRDRGKQIDREVDKASR